VLGKIGVFLLDVMTYLEFRVRFSRLSRSVDLAERMLDDLSSQRLD